MLQIIKIESEAQWLGLRKNNINSTESSAFFGMSPYMSAFELFHLKKGTIEDGFVANSRTKAGQHMEEAIAKYALNELGLEGQPMKDYYYDDEDRMGTSCDWEITSPGEYMGHILEVKNVDFLQYRDKWTEHEAPNHIETQVQHQMEVTDRDGAIIVALVGGNDLKFIYRKRDKEMGAGLRNATKEFWKAIDEGMEPEPDYNGDADLIIKMHQAAGEAVLDGRGSVMINALFNEYDMLKKLAKESDDAKSSKKAEILDAIGDDYMKVTGADGYTLSCGMTKGTEPTVITQDMVGKTYGGRKSYRTFLLNKKKAVK